MNWLHDRASQLPTKDEIDSLYFHLAMLIVAGLLLAFSLGFTCGARMRSRGNVKCVEEISEVLQERCWDVA